jgi:Tfp pilus assembly protein PilX
MRCVSNQRGVALVTALILTLVSLAMVLVVIYFITQGAATSGLQKRYQTALEVPTAAERSSQRKASASRSVLRTDEQEDNRLLGRRLLLFQLI